MDGDVVPVHVVRDGARGEEGQLQGARQRGQIRDTDWRMGKPFRMCWCLILLLLSRLRRLHNQSYHHIQKWLDLPNFKVSSKYIDSRIPDRRSPFCPDSVISL